ncbi:hypothetical protein PSU4_58670 [Pseudonocardia sulfidoxydans NBRC 16205]|uniref:Uncharacterized protein n=1 Tax=Pseudonocardia sulfidoxydans NBRC 16205 TaxID=1223511 RepID=A0A511DRS3_9PSEU|nr:hypothetical protein [Pseudonocardia sulfidoxydans]GEL26913.1 hypothetical protein PSU4_58670 [Pseudonocardia sulfidoxydans NBRC 16205]
MLTEQEFLVLNSLYLKKMTSVCGLADIAGLSVGEVQPLVGRFTAQNWVMDLGDELVIQPGGMVEVESYYREVFTDPALQDGIAQWYRRFETVNTRFIKLVSDWQQSDGDAKVLDRIVSTVERLINSIGEVTHLVPRYSGYVRRFERSIAKVDRGDLDFVCTPTVDSVHNIWFELHEDALLLLGKERTE